MEILRDHQTLDFITCHFLLIIRQIFFFILKSFLKFRIRIMFLFSREDCGMKVKMPIYPAIQDPLIFNNFLFAFLPTFVLYYRHLEGGRQIQYSAWKSIYVNHLVHPVHFLFSTLQLPMVLYFVLARPRETKIQVSQDVTYSWKHPALFILFSYFPLVCTNWTKWWVSL